MWHAEHSVKPVRLSEDDVWHVQFKVFPYPLVTPEPHEFHSAGFVDKIGHQSFSPFLFHGFEMHNFPNQLHIR